ncbi:rhamnogalacturonan acetylesterase [Asticcacaulis sp. 201]|uniref:rhamnogalacturonan acetylesterase n=1 Tax=Asticcacaulis sp. 201 TaxID=3028787 RepID=UPI0029165D47|nr:rhamnogalacturonan acetylesterase [Asticcacaulis sp. 201]MDV6331100.1 rhamnogalacturonan acetylesterase [Asticcacaulis sp. 201]
MIISNHSFGILVSLFCLAFVSPAFAFDKALPNPPLAYMFRATNAPSVGAVSVDDAPYDAGRGYGFVSTPNGNERAFSVRVPEGDYKVTVTVGDANAPTRTSLWAEDRRLVAAPVVLKKGEVRTLSFIVNVRNPFLALAEQDAVKSPKVGLRGDDALGRTWDDQLTISVSGRAPALNGLTIEPVQVRRVLLAGDSTVTDQAGSDYASWGQMLPRFLDGVSVANHARSGETMKSFLTSARWDKLMSQTRPGDVVLIQFAHNDEKKQWPRTYAAADGAYPAFLAALVADVRQSGASPVLVTPVARRTFDNGRIKNSHEGYDAAVRRVATELKVPLIDLTAQTTTLYEALGPEKSSLAFGNYGKDGTHHNAYGAWQIACYVARDLGAAGLGLTPVGTDACDPGRPADPLSYELQPADWPVMRTPEAPKQGPEPTPVK